MEQRTRIRINLAQREVEIEGSESFVRGYERRIESLLERLLAQAAAQPAAAPPDATSSSPLGSFGEFIHHLPSRATEVDKMLAAGFWVQQGNPDRSFSTAEASRRLAEHGIKIGNPSQCVRQAMQAKRAFSVQKGRYRVAQRGQEHLRRLMGAVIPAPPGGDVSP